MVCLSAEGVRSSVQGSFSVGDLKVEIRKDITLSCLASAKILLFSEVLQVLVIRIHLNQLLGIAEVRLLVSKCRDDSHQFLVVNCVLPLRVSEFF